MSYFPVSSGPEKRAARKPPHGRHRSVRLAIVLQLADLALIIAAVLVLLLAVVRGWVLPKGPRALLVHPVARAERRLQLFVVDRVVVVRAFRLNVVHLVEKIDHRLDGVLNASAVLPGDLQPPPARR